MDPRASLDDLEKKRVSYACSCSNLGSSSTYPAYYAILVSLKRAVLKIFFQALLYFLFKVDLSFSVIHNQ